MRRCLAALFFSMGSIRRSLGFPSRHPLQCWLGNDGSLDRSSFLARWGACGRIGGLRPVEQTAELSRGTPILKIAGIFSAFLHYSLSFTLTQAELLGYDHR